MENKSKFYHIQFEFISTKVIMFSYYGSKYLYLTYIILFLTSFGLNSQQVGIITGFCTAMQAVGGIALGFLVDYTKKQKLVFIVAILCMILSLFSMPFIGYFMTHSNGIKQPGVKRSELKINGSDLTKTGASSMLHQNKFVSENLTLFWLFFLCSIIYGISDGINGLIDVSVFSHVDRYGKSKTSYSLQKLWASIGYGLVPSTAGFALTIFQDSSISLFMPVFYLFVLLNLALLFCICRTFSFNDNTKEELDVNDLQENGIVHQDTSQLKAYTTSILRSLLRTDMLVVMLNSLLNGIARVVQWGFLFYLMKTDMTNSTNAVMGISLVVSSIVEALIAPMIVSVSNKLGSVFIASSLSLFGYSLTFLFYSYCENGIAIIFISIITGLGYPFYMYNIQEQLYKFSKIECRTFMFTLDHSIYNGIGGGLGGIVGANLYKAYGGRIMYRSFGVCFIFFGAITLFYGLYKQNPLTGEREKDSDNLIDTTRRQETICH